MISDTMTKSNKTIKKRACRKNCSTLLDLKMRHRSAKLRILGAVQEILSLPSAKLFTSQSKEEMNKIICNIEKNVYNQPNEIFDDINNIIEETEKKIRLLQ